MRVEGSEGLTAAFGERKKTLPRVVRGGLAADQPDLLEAAQDAAEVAGVELELARNIARRTLCRAGARLDLIEHARLGERKRAVAPARLQHADACGVEAIELAHCGDALAQF